MQPGEVLVALLGRGATVVRYKEEAASRVSVALGRNKQARIPADRILLATGVVAAESTVFEELRHRAEEMALAIDLAEAWGLLADEAQAVSLEELGALLWSSLPDATHLVALALRLDRDTDLFVREDSAYLPRGRDEVEGIRARRRREAENARDAEALVEGLAKETLPDPLSQHQERLIDHLREYAVHGEDYPQHDRARELVGLAASGGRDLQRRCFELLVAASVFSPDEPLELHRAGVQEDFPEDAVAEAERLATASRPSVPERRDLTALEALTIDDAGTEDRDDALSLETVEGGYRLGVHIADAGSIIPHDGAVEREADRRMATLYLPEGKVEMLPAGLASRAGSLEPGEARQALSLLAMLDNQGAVLDWEVAPSVIQSSAALTYEEADRALGEEGSEWGQLLGGLDRIARSLKSKRERAGAVNVDQAELSVKVAPSGEVTVTVQDRSSPSRRLVAELMILCNSLLAELCRDRDLPAVYRSQEKPTPVDTDEASAAEGPVLGEPERALRLYRLTRRLAPAKTGKSPSPHVGLGVQAYVQATSPLRRYPDLVIQRQISHHLRTGTASYSPEHMASVGQRAEVQLRELARVEDARRRYWFVKYLEQSRLEASGAPESLSLFHATVLEPSARRLALLELAEFPFRVRAELPRDRAPGETVTLKLQGVDLWRRVGLFVHVE